MFTIAELYISNDLSVEITHDGRIDLKRGVKTLTSRLLFPPKFDYIKPEWLIPAGLVLKEVYRFDPQLRINPEVLRKYLNKTFGLDDMVEAVIEKCMNDCGYKIASCCDEYRGFGIISVNPCNNGFTELLFRGADDEQALVLKIYAERLLWEYTPQELQPIIWFLMYCADVPLTCKLLWYLEGYRYLL